MILLTAICAACLASDALAGRVSTRQPEAAAVKAKILLSRLSISSIGADESASSKIRTLLDELFSLAQFDATPGADYRTPITRSEQAGHESPQPSPQLSQRPPPFSVLA